MNVQPIKVDKLSATEKATDFAGTGYELGVTGDALVPNTAAKAKLRDRVPQGISPRILQLDLVIEQTGPAGGALTEKPIEPFVKKVSSREYDEVEVFSEGKSVAKTKVQRILS